MREPSLQNKTKDLTEWRLVFSQRESLVDSAFVCRQQETFYPFSCLSSNVASLLILTYSLDSNYEPQDQEEQIRLEMRHREEEDALYRQFAKKRAEEESSISQQIQEEWELELERLTSRFQQELGTKKSRKNISTDEERALTVKLQHEKADLEKNMTIKLDRKKGSITKKLLEQERQATAELVDKHSREMIHLINERLEQFKQVS